MGELTNRKKQPSGSGQPRKIRKDLSSSSRAERSTGWRAWMPVKEDALILAIIVGAVYFYWDLMHVIAHRPADFAGMHRAGQLAARTLAHVEPHVVAGATTAQLDELIHQFITSHPGAVPATLGYRGFKHSSCISVNEVVCHGIPSDATVLKRGDIVNIDVTPVVDGWHGDTSKTFIVGGAGAASEVAAKLVRVTREALEIGLKACRPNGRMGAIVYPLQKHIENAGFSVVTKYTAHGIGRRFHAPPHIEHGGSWPAEGALLKVGMFFTIEPMANEGTKHTTLLKDGWTVVTADGKLSAQFEHTIGVGEDGCEIFTRVPGSEEFI